MDDIYKYGKDALAGKDCCKYSPDLQTSDCRKRDIYEIIVQIVKKDLQNVQGYWNDKVKTKGYKKWFY